MKCPNCNTTIVDNAKFCHNCGKIAILPSPNQNDQGKWGYVDEAGNVVIPHKYHMVNPFEDGQAFVQSYTNGELIGMLIDSEGKVITELNYSRIGDFHDGVALVNIGGSYSDGNGYVSGSFGGGSYGYINEAGKELIPVIYRDATNFESGYAAIDISSSYPDGKQWVFIDDSGKRISDNYYADIGLDVMDWREDHGYGYRNIGFYHYDFSEDCWGFCHKRAKVSNGQKWGFIDTKGKEIVPLQYDEVIGFTYKYYTTVRLGNKWGVIDRLGRHITLIIYDRVQLFADETSVSYASLYKDEKCGVIKIDFGEITEIVPFEYINCHVELNSKYIYVHNQRAGILDFEGKEIIPCLYDHIFCGVSPEFLIVSINGKEGVIDWHNNILVPCEYSFISEHYGCCMPHGEYFEYFFSEGYFWINKDKKCGAVNLKGEEAIPCIYDNILAKFKDGVAIVEKNKGYYCIDYYGNELSLDNYSLDRYWKEDGAAVNIYNSTDGNVIDTVVFKQLLSLKANKGRFLEISEEVSEHKD